MPRVKLFDEEKALKQALELFWEKGYEATSLSDITDTLRIGKGSFYNTFGSKRALFDKCLNAYQTSSFETLDHILAEKTNLVDSIKHMLDTHTEMMLTDTSPKGCFIANSTAELADDRLVKDFLEAHNQVMRSKLMNLLANSRYADDAEALADLILTHVTGISMMSKFIRDRKRFQLTNEIFMKVFER